MPVKEAPEWAKEMVAEFVRQSEQDPDIASESDDFRRGYERGILEMALVWVDRAMKPRL